MNKIIGISGAHGTGKSVTIERVRDLNISDIFVDQFKVSRTVLAELGLTLEQATSSAESTKNYQTKVVNAKIIYDSALADKKFCRPNILVDRSIADIYAYTKLWCEKNNIEETWFSLFTNLCVKAMDIYDIIILFPTGVFSFVDDGIRAKEDTQAIIAKYTEEFVKEHAKQYHIIDTITIEDRANQIIEIIKNNGNSKISS